MLIVQVTRITSNFFALPRDISSGVACGMSHLESLESPVLRGAFVARERREKIWRRYLLTHIHAFPHHLMHVLVSTLLFSTSIMHGKIRAD